ncbi:MAG: hypothetical protein Q9173_000587 [Seirophora scorigena]
MFNSAYLGQFASHRIPLELTRHHLAADAEAEASSFRSAEAPFGIFLGWAAQANRDSPERLYVAQAPLNQLPKPLRDDLPTPELVVKAGKGDVYDTSIWLGVAPTNTPLHRDPNPNLYLQLAGRKVIRLLEPGFGRSVFAAVQAELGTQHPGKFRGEEMMKGEEKRLLEAKIWLDKPAENQEDFTGLEATLEADEYLFIPKGWWHSVKSIGTGCTASVAERQSQRHFAELSAHGSRIFSAILIPCRTIMDNPNHDPALEQTSLQSGRDDDKDNATKRKRKDVPSRTKRNRYISIAW